MYLSTKQWDDHQPNRHSLAHLFKKGVHIDRGMTRDYFPISEITGDAEIPLLAISPWEVKRPFAPCHRISDEFTMSNKGGTENRPPEWLEIPIWFCINAMWKSMENTEWIRNSLLFFNQASWYKDCRFTEVTQGQEAEKCLRGNYDGNLRQTGVESRRVVAATGVNPTCHRISISSLHCYVRFG